MTIEARSLRKQYPSFSLDASLVLADGEIVCLLGPSGCGKSTLVRLLARLENPDSGSLIIDGRDMSLAKPRDLGVGMVFQDHALFPGISVQDNVAYGLLIRGVGKKERRTRANALLGRLGLSGFGARRVGDLSGGERQKVALARALAIDPALVLLDEPLSSIDEGQRENLRVEIRRLLKGFGATALYVTHDIDEAFAVADRIVLMRAGRIEASGSPHALWNKPPSAFVAEFLGSGTLVPVLGKSESSVETPFGNMRFSADRSAPSDPERSLHIASGAVALSETAGKNKAGHNSFAALCESREFTRGVWRCLLIRDNSAITVGFSGDHIPQAGETSLFAVNVEDCSLVPGPCGTRR